LLITGNVMIDRRHLNEPYNVVMDDPGNLHAYRRWARAGQPDGTRAFVQLSHPGRQEQRSVSSRPIAPSAVRVRLLPGMFATPRAIAAKEIPELIARFARSAEIAAQGGFAGVQLHGAHGYLISQFLSPLTNLRDDDWGGRLANRAAFALEIIRAIRRRVPNGFAIAVKLNSADFQRGGFTEEESIEVARMLESEGIDLLELSGGTYETPVMFGVGATRESTLRREAYFLAHAQRLRAAVSVPLMLTGGFRTTDGMRRAVETRAVDVVGLARPLVFHDDLPARVLSGREAPAVPTSPRAGTRMDFAIDDYWHVQQIHQRAAGRPAHSRGMLRTLAGSLLTMSRWQLDRHRYRQGGPVPPAHEHEDRVR
jgi:2,4-dienoyl-CoA reductase-like NADH-dependent reductase (Old Yellow Enzyme family)